MNRYELLGGVLVLIMFGIHPIVGILFGVGLAIYCYTG